MEGLRISRATTGDIAPVQEIARETLRKTASVFLGEETVAGFIESGQSDAEISDHFSNLYVARLNGRIVGFVIYWEGSIHLMMVDAKLHRAGVGTAILQWCETQMRVEGHDRAQLQTFVGNAQAIGFYLRNGWTESHRDGPEAGDFAKATFAKSLT
ncbi:GNAT family N-acetyltransferase [Ruegeria sediminis]|uniref:GNAT family N-acetyltransferase n=1 Tax=Ruegeria sediminis TaxID=2583820 RepID=A0ABY2WV13_9RHOB|nr:GNAT family N-acetyltransferase [Ruegeria sediminis]TMV06443.1 GNAT family N-acetyltransferase [Ruegeria sediminis]